MTDRSEYEMKWKMWKNMWLQETDIKGNKIKMKEERREIKLEKNWLQNALMGIENEKRATVISEIDNAKATANKVLNTNKIS